MWKNYQVSAVSWCLVSGTMNNEATISVWVTVGRGCSIFQRQWSRWVTLLVTPSSPHPWKLALVHPSVHQRRGLRTFPHSDDSDSEIRASNEGSRRFVNIVKLRQGSGKVRQGKARKGKDGERWKALKLKPLPWAYIKVGCHPPPTTTTTHKFIFVKLMAWSG